ncbi:ABC-2 and plant PDR ABC-type transporter family protein [Actinidia rufa]|uniref:ABC-2 and plant PDR ABC-type transporter family protein n=1 Tax=Actinidia rufa TaxID=165716 RepID=A0A7J0FZK0_9ERIC|nr:ABC-2 and plant PDR ABC-type transporter family protein [Actinidia rufa]
MQPFYSQGIEAELTYSRYSFAMVGIVLPTVEVRFEHLTIEADCYIGDRALPSLVNAARNIAESTLELLTELARREKDAGIFPEAEIDLFMKATAMEGVESSLITDYTLRVTSRKDQEQYWADRSSPYSYVSVTEFARRFKRFHVGLRLENELSVPYAKARSHKAALVYKKYSVPKKELLKASFDKEWLLIKRNSFVYVFKTVQIIIVAIIAATVFLRTEMHTRNEGDGAFMFFKQLLVVFLIQQTAAGIFRLIAGVCRTMIIANTGGALTLLLVFLLGGFILPKDQIPKWWQWGYWVSPMTYCFNALAVNEMFAPRWMNKLASDNVTRLGVAVLKNFQVFPDRNWFWIGTAALFGFAVLLNILFTLHSYVLESRNGIQRMGSLSKNGLTRNEDSNIEIPRGVALKRGMVLPYSPLAMSFNSVNYFVDMPAVSIPIPSCVVFVFMFSISFSEKQ